MGYTTTLGEALQPSPIPTSLPQCLTPLLSRNSTPLGWSRQLPHIPRTVHSSRPRSRKSPMASHTSPFCDRKRCLTSRQLQARRVTLHRSRSRRKRFRGCEGGFLRSSSVSLMSLQVFGQGATSVFHSSSIRPRSRTGRASSTSSNVLVPFRERKHVRVL